MTWLKNYRVSLATLSITASFLVLSVIGGWGAAQSWEMRVCADNNSMPFSRQDQRGMENLIANLLAEELDATISYHWWPFGSTMVRDHLREGNCDLIVGIPDGYSGLLSTVALYRSPFVFVYRADSGFTVSTFDDPVLHELRIGIQSITGPAHEALVRRDLVQNIELEFTRSGGDSDPDPLSELIEALNDGVIDVAISWGAAAGYYVARQEQELVMVPTPLFEPPFTPLYMNMVIGVRPGDEALRDRLNRAIASRWDDIREILYEYSVPILELPRPTFPGGAQ